MFSALKASAFILFCYASTLFAVGNPSNSSSASDDYIRTLKAEIEGLVLPPEQQSIRATLITRLMAAQHDLSVKPVVDIFIETMKSFLLGFTELQELAITLSSDIREISREMVLLFEQIVDEKRLLWKDVRSEQRCMNLFRRLQALELQMHMLYKGYLQWNLDSDNLHKVQRIEGALLQLEHLQLEQRMQRSLVAGRLHWMRRELEHAIQKAQENIPPLRPKQMLHLLLDLTPNATEALIRLAAPEHAVLYEIKQHYSKLLQQVQALPEILLEEECMQILLQIEELQKQMIHIAYPSNDSSIGELKQQLFKAKHQQHWRMLQLSMDLIWGASSSPCQSGELFHIPLQQDEAAVVPHMSLTVSNVSEGTTADVTASESNDKLLANAARHEKHLLTLLTKLVPELQPNLPRRILVELLLSLQQRIQNFRMGGIGLQDIERFEQKNNELLQEIQEPLCFDSAAEMKRGLDLLDKVQEHDRQFFLFNEQLYGVTLFPVEEVQRLKELRRKVLQSMHDQQRQRMMDTLSLLSIRRPPLRTVRTTATLENDFHQVPTDS